MTASTFLLCSLLLPMPPEAVEMHYLSRWRVLRWLPILRSFLGGCGAVCAWRSDAAGLQERRAVQVHCQARSFSICANVRTYLDPPKYSFGPEVPFCLKQDNLWGFWPARGSGELSVGFFILFRALSGSPESRHCPT